MSVPDPVREYNICLIIIIRGQRCKLKTLEERAWRQDCESLAMKNLFGGKDKIVLSASIIAKHSAMNNDAVGGRLLEKEMWSSGM